ncbi:transposase [Streptomyces inhibens]|uniref:transposase n=1 Tax=Streptomyces inhibens TaxID=2293571 RepID=UPI0036C36516
MPPEAARNGKEGGQSCTESSRPSPTEIEQPQRPRSAGLRLWAEGRDWLTVSYLPPYAPDLNPVEGIRSLLRRGRLSNGARGCASQRTSPDRRSRTNVSKRER